MSPNIDEWELMYDIVETLRCFKYAEKFLEGQHYVTGSKVISVVTEIRNHLDLSIVNPTLIRIQPMLLVLQSELQKRFGNGIDIVPMNTPYYNAQEGDARKPVGWTALQCLQSIFDNSISRDVFTGF